jgi:SAM-dependent methyltransferase
MTNTARLPILSFLITTAAIQLLAAAVCVIAWSITPVLVISILASTTVALLAAAAVNLPAPWRVLNAFLPLAAAATLSIEVPSAIYAIPLVVLAAVYAPALLTRVPYYPTSRPTYALLLAELPTDRPFRFVDIGCGFGDLLIFLAKHRPNGHFIGVELGLLPYIIARIRAKTTPKKNIDITCRDMWSFPVADCDFVYTFLSPAAMERIWSKLSHEMSPGSTFITNSFPVPAEPSETIQVRDERSSTLYIHRFQTEQRDTLGVQRRSSHN